MSGKLSFLEHLEELRRRIIFVLIIYILAAIACYIWGNEILGLLQRPIGQLIFISPTELFLTRIKLALFSALFIVFPFFLLEFYLYISPALGQGSNKFFKVFSAFSLILFYSSLIVSYKLFLPYTLKFLSRFNATGVVALITVSRYISFLFLFLLIFSLLSQIPLVILFLTRSGLWSIDFLKSRRKYIYLISFIVAAVLTPPDVVTQFLLAIPLIILFEFSILICSFFGYNKKA